MNAGVNVGAYIKKRMDERGMGVRELARAIGKSPATIINAIGDKQPSLTEATLHEMEKALGFETDVLVLLCGKVPADVLPLAPAELGWIREHRMTKKWLKSLPR